MDLSQDACRVHRDSTLRSYVGWKVTDDRGKLMPLKECVAGAQHVDDALLLFRVLCSTCLLRGVQRLWPQDVGVSCEGSLPSVDFLTVTVTVDKAGNLSVKPFNANSDFVYGKSKSLKVSRIIPFSPSYEARSSLRLYVISKVCSFNKIVSGSAVGGAIPLAELICEVLLLGWPNALVGRALAAIPCRHHEGFIYCTRRVGRILRKSSIAPGPNLIHKLIEMVNDAAVGLKVGIAQ